MVRQECANFYQTPLRSNITLHDEDVSDQEVWAAAEAVGASDFINKYEDKLDLQVRERGAMLSVGQDS